MTKIKELHLVIDFPGYPIPRTGEPDSTVVTAQGRIWVQPAGSDMTRTVGLNQSIDAALVCLGQDQIGFVAQEIAEFLRAAVQHLEQLDDGQAAAPESEGEHADEPAGDSEPLPPPPG